MLYKYNFTERKNKQHFACATEIWKSEVNKSLIHSSMPLSSTI